MLLSQTQTPRNTDLNTLTRALTGDNNELLRKSLLNLLDDMVTEVVQNPAAEMRKLSHPLIRLRIEFSREQLNTQEVRHLLMEVHHSASLVQPHIGNNALIHTICKFSALGIRAFRRSARQ